MLSLLFISALGNAGIAWLVWKRGEKTKANSWFVVFALTLALYILLNAFWIIFANVVDSHLFDKATWYSGFITVIACFIWVDALVNKTVSKSVYRLSQSLLLFNFVLIFFAFENGGTRTGRYSNLATTATNWAFNLYALIFFAIFALIIYKLATTARKGGREARSVLLGIVLFAMFYIPNSYIAPYILGEIYDPFLDSAFVSILTFFLAYTTVFQKHGNIQSIISSDSVFYIGYTVLMLMYTSIMLNVSSSSNLLSWVSGTDRNAVIGILLVIGSIVIYILLRKILNFMFGFKAFNTEKELRDLGAKVPNMQLLAHEMYDRFSAIRNVESCVIVMRHPETDRMIAMYPEGRSVILDVGNALFTRFQEHSGWVSDQVVSDEEKRVMQGLKSNVVIVLSFDESINGVILLSVQKDLDVSVLNAALSPHIERYTTMLAGAYSYWSAVGRVIGKE